MISTLLVISIVCFVLSLATKRTTGDKSGNLSKLNVTEGKNEIDSTQSLTDITNRRREELIRIERNRKLAEQQRKERLEKELRVREELRMETIQKIKDSLQWKC